METVETISFKRKRQIHVRSQRYINELNVLEVNTANNRKM